jgi:hypothetical protein
MRLFPCPLRLSIFYGSRDQLRTGVFLPKREKPGNEVGLSNAIFGVTRFKNGNTQIKVTKYT